MNDNKQQPLVIYQPGSSLTNPLMLLPDLWREAYRSRGLAWQLFVRDFKAKYRQSVLGYAWAVLPPLVNAGIFIFLNATGAIRIADTGVPYPLFVITGMMVWQCFAEALTTPSVAMAGAKQLYSKINFPREAILISGFGMLCFSILVRAAIVAIVLLVFRVVPTSQIVWFPIAFGALIALGFAIGIICGIAESLLTDSMRLLTLATQFLLYTTPVLYPPREDGMIGFLSRWNPLSPLVINARSSLLGSVEPGQLRLMLLALPVIVLLFAFSWIAYRTVMPRLIERMPS